VVLQIAEVSRTVRADRKAGGLVATQTLVRRQLGGAVKWKHGRVWIWQRVKDLKHPQPAIPAALAMVPGCHKSHGVVDLDDLPGRAKRQAHVVVDGPIGVEIEIVVAGLKRRRIAGIRQVAKDALAIADPNVGTNVQETVGVCRCNHRATIA
jgi:hypothetical protein